MQQPGDRRRPHCHRTALLTQDLEQKLDRGGRDQKAVLHNSNFHSRTVSRPPALPCPSQLWKAAGERTEGKRAGPGPQKHLVQELPQRDAPVRAGEPSLRQQAPHKERARRARYRDRHF